MSNSSGVGSSSILGQLNMNKDEADKKRRLDIQELEGIWNNAYKNENNLQGEDESFSRQNDLAKGNYCRSKCTLVSISL